MTTVISEMPLGVSRIVRKSAGEPDGAAARFVLAERFTADASGARELDNGSCLIGGSRPATAVRSFPIANCAAPETSTRATAPDIPVASRDISCPTVRDLLAVHQRGPIPKGFVTFRPGHEKMWQRKNRKKLACRLERSFWQRVFLPAGYPPCPIDRRLRGAAVVMPAAPRFAFVCFAGKRLPGSTGTSGTRPRFADDGDVSGSRPLACLLDDFPVAFSTTF